jgi:hypothetical protein
MRVRLEYAGLALATVLGFALRVRGGQFGLPLWSNLYIRPDESLLVTAAAGLFENAGDPRIYVYPALMIDLAAILYAVYEWFTGAAFGRDPSAYFLIARWISIVAGTAAIPLAWWIARRVSGRAGAFAAAFLFALAPLPVRDAHFAVTDTLLMLFVAAMTAFGVEALLRPAGRRMKMLQGMAVCFGLAVSTKYTAVVMLPLLLGAALYALWPLGGMRAVRSTALLCIWPALMFALTNPYVVTEPRRAAGSVAGTLLVLYRDSSPDASWYRPEPLMQIWRPLRHGAGGSVGVLMALAASFVALWRARSNPALAWVALAAWAIPASILPFRHPAPYRYLLPALPALAVLAASAIAWLGQRTKRTWVTVVIAGVLGLMSGVQSLRVVERLARTDTRSLAGQWIEQNAGSTPVLFTSGAECEPQVRESKAALERRIRETYARWGELTGNIIAAPYRMMLPHAGAGVEVYRPGGEPLPPGGEYYASFADTPAAHVRSARNS